MLESAAMPKTRISVTVERALLDEFKEAAGKEAKLSEVVSFALRYEIRRLGQLALLDEWEREDPEDLRLLASVRGRTHVIAISDAIAVLTKRRRDRSSQISRR
jgi:hypothetical protein